MSNTVSNRRDFLKTSAGIAAVSAAAPYAWTSSYAKAEDKNDRPNLASIGLGGMGSHDGRSASRFADMVACCDVDSQRAEKFASGFERTWTW